MQNEVEKFENPASDSYTAEGAAETPSTEQELDYKSLYFDALGTTTKLEEERDNYKKGLLAAKGKAAPEEVDNKAKMEGKINYLEEQIKSLQNSRAPSVSAGSSQLKGVETPKHGWGPDQVKDLKHKFPGWTDNDVEKSWQTHQKNINKT